MRSRSWQPIPAKMSRLVDVIGQFLDADESIRSAPHLGGDAPKITQQQVSFLIDRLKAASTQNSRIAAILIGVYIAMLIVGFIIVLTLFRNATAMRAALGGSFLSLLVIVKGLHSVWRESHGMQVMLALLPSLSPEEAIKVVESYYYKIKNVRESRRKKAA